MYSAASAALIFAYGILLCADLLAGSQFRSNLWLSLGSILLVALAGLVCLTMGDRLGPLPALAIVATNTLTAVLFITTLQSPSDAVGIIVQMPVLALYMGAFLSRWIARATQLAVLLAFGLTVAWDPYHLLGGLTGGRNFINIVLFTWICLEAGVFVQRKFRAETRFDQLTGVYNRRGFVDVSSQERARAERNGHPVCVAVVDLDGFKEVNDTEGHIAGDRVLRDLTRQWTGLLRETDTIARIGGDEFVFLLPDANLEAARRTLARLNAQSVHPWSWGVALWDTKDLVSVDIAHADDEMNVNKSSRREAQRADPAAAPPAEPDAAPA